MKRRWTALSLAVLFCLTTSCAWQSGFPKDPSDKKGQPSQLAPSHSLDQLPKDLWSADWPLGVELPEDHGGLELPIQGATGYPSIELPLWETPEDAAAAAEAVAAWEAAQLEGGEALPAETVPGEAQEASAETTAAQEGAAGPAARSAGEPEPVPAPEAGPEEGSSPQSAAAPPQEAGEEPALGEGELPAETEGPEVPTLTDGALTLLPSGTPFTVLEEKEGWWRIAVEADYYTDEEETEPQHGELTGWVENRFCLVNLPDVIPSMVYDATNSYSSLFVTCGKPIPKITGEAFYPGQTYNPRLDREEFMMPVLYPMARKLCQAQRAALEDGNTLVLYEGYRPNEVQSKVYQAMSALVREDPEVRAAVSDPPWQISWFIASGYSNHQRGYAVDVGLARALGAAERSTNGCRYLQITDYRLYEMPTPIHELSRAAATFTAPVNSYSATAWKEAELSEAMNVPALGLQDYCTGAGLTPLSSEWWHFNDLDAYLGIKDHEGIGDFVITSIRSAPPGAQTGAAA